MSVHGKKEMDAPTEGVCNDGFVSESSESKADDGQNSIKYADVELGDGSTNTGIKGANKVEATGKVNNEQSVKSQISTCKDWLTGTNFFVYTSHFLSAWGDRMWAFGVGLFLIEIASSSLQLTAIYGLSSASTYLLFGAIIGDWVDRTPRLRAAQISLGLQNVFVIVCAAMVYVHLWFLDYIHSQWDGWMLRASYAVIILFAILSNMASMARTIAVEKDWVVEICGKDKDMLAQMTSALRRIDLGTKILAPIATGQIMTYVGLEFGAVFIGGWNLATVFIEYYLIWKVYHTVPALRRKKEVSKFDDREAKMEEVELKDASEMEVGEDKDKDNDIDKSAKPENISLEDKSIEGGAEKSVDIKDKNDEEKSYKESGQIEIKEGVEATKSVKKEESGCKFGKAFVTLYKGWRTYLQYSVCNAGIGLAFLYMTVLGFDNITVGYAYSQKISESILGFLMAGAAIVGILGTIAYPIIRRRIGLERTGLFALTTQILCLVVCVVSVFMPGSPFNLLHRTRDSSQTNCTVLTQSSIVEYNETTSISIVIVTNNVTNLADNVTDLAHNVTNPCTDESSRSYSYISIAMLMTGIITARFGLWTADLTITQLFMEKVEEKERGIVNGVQQSLNRLMDLLKFAMVVAAPEPELFGVLVFISFGFVCLGAAFYASYSRKARGHLFHFEKIVKCSNNNSQQYVTSQAA